MQPSTQMTNLSFIYFILSGVYFWVGIFLLGFWRTIQELKEDHKKYFYFTFLLFSTGVFTFAAAFNEMRTSKDELIFWAHTQWTAVVLWPLFLTLTISEIWRIPKKQKKILKFIYTPFCILVLLVSFIPGTIVTDKIITHDFNFWGYQYSQSRVIVSKLFFYHISIGVFFIIWTLYYAIRSFLKNQKELLNLIYIILFTLFAILEFLYFFIKREFDLSMFVAPTFWPIGLAIFIILMATNVFLELMKLGRERKKQGEILHHTNEEISFLMGTISHDIKGPLLSIRSFAELLENKNNLPKDKIEHYLNRIHTNANHLKQLLNDLADYSKIGRTEEKLENINFRKTIEEAANILNLAEDHPQINLKIEGDLKNCLASKKRMKEVIINLIQNSIKYIPESKGNIIFRLKKLPHGNMIYCEDDGIGIPREFHKRVFEKFFRHDPKQKGTGMGLAIVQKIVESFQGEVWVDPDFSDGTCLCIFLPDLKTYFTKDSQKNYLKKNQPIRQKMN